MAKVFFVRQDALSSVIRSFVDR